MPLGGPGLFRNPTRRPSAWAGYDTATAPPYPIITGRAQGASDTAITPQVPTLPAGVVPGELLLVCLANDNANTTPSTSSTGWTLLATQAQGSTTNHTGSIFYKVATGSDALSVDLTGAGGAQEVTWTSYRIANAGTPVAAGLNGGSAASFTAPTLGPALGNYLTLVAVMTDSSAGLTQVVTFPGGWVNPAGTNPGVTSSAATFSAEQTLLATSSIAPGTVGLGLSEQWVAFTVAIPWASAPAAPPTPGTVLNIGPGGAQNHFKVQVAPVGNPSQVDHEQSEIAAGYTEDPYFVTTPDGARVQFYARLDGPLSSGAAGGSRSELREMDQAGTTEAAWNALLGRHVYQFKIRGVHFPPVNPACVLTQLHDGGDGDRISIRTQLSGGIVKLICKINGTSVGYPVLADPYVPGTDFEVKLVIDGNGFLDVYYNDLVTPVIAHAGPLTSTAGGTDTWYWKTGVYNQSSTDVGTEYSEAELTSLSYSHSAVATYIKTGAAAAGSVGAGPKTVSAPVTYTKAGAGVAGAVAKGAKTYRQGPASVGTIGNWWAADVVSQSDGTTVNPWPGNTGPAEDATQATAGNRATFKTNIVNGRPVLRFDGTDSYLSAANASLGQTTMFAVVRPTGTAGYQTIRGSQIAGGLQWRIGLGKSELVKESQAAIGTASTTLSTSVFSVLSAAHADATSYAFYLNGTADGSGSHAVTLVGGALTEIGKNTDQGGEYLVGDLAELIVYVGVLSAGDRAKVHSYLSDKYGVTVSDYVAPPAPVVVIAKTGTGVAGATGAGAQMVTRVETGTGVAAGVGRGAKTVLSPQVTSTKAGTGAARAAASGLQTVTRVETGTGTAVGASTGAKVVTRVETGTGVAAGVGRGAKTVLSPQVTSTKAGTGAVAGVGWGAQALTSPQVVYTRTASAVAVAAARGTGLALAVPQQVGNIANWFRADSLAQADGTPVSAWPDSTGPAGVATQGTAANQPTFRTNVVNGKPVIRFDGNNRFLLSLANSSIQHTTIFAVVRPTTTAGYQTIRGSSQMGGLQYRIGLGYPELLEQSVAVVGTSPTILSTATFSIISVDFNDATSYAFYHNGSTAASGTTAVALDVAAYTTVIGAIANEHLAGDLAELIVYHLASLSAADRAKVHTYLSDKYGIVVADYVGQILKAGTGAAAGVGAGAKTLTSPQVVYTKAGTGAAGCVASGAKVVTRVESGTATAATAPAGAKTVTRVESGTAAAVGAGSAAKVVTRVETGTAVVLGAPAGVKVVTRVESGTGAAGTTAAGVQSVTGATAIVQAGAAVARGAGAGVSALTSPQVVYTDTVTGAAGLVGSGVKVVTGAGTIVKAGTAAAGTVGAGVQARTSAAMHTRVATSAARGAGAGVQARTSAATHTRVATSVAGTAAAGAQQVGGAITVTTAGAGAVGAVARGTQALSSPQVVRTKAGTAAAAGAAGGAQAIGTPQIVYTRTATAAAGGVAAGARTVTGAGTIAKAGAAAAAPAGAGTWTRTSARSATVVAGTTAAGGKAVTTARTGLGAAQAAGSGGKAVSGAQSIDKAGAAAAAPAGRGTQTVDHPQVVRVTTGGGTASATVRGVQAVDHPQVTSTKTGTGAAWLAAGGATALQSAGQIVKIGAGAATPTAAGVSALASPQVVYTRSGAGAAGGTATGTSTVTHPTTYPKAGAGTATATVAAPKAIQSAGVILKAGTGATAAVAAGPRSMVLIKLGAVTAAGVPSGAKVRELVGRTVRVVASGTGHGGKVRELADRPGRGAATGVTAGGRGREFQRTGTPTAAACTAGSRVRLSQRTGVAAATAIIIGGTDRGPRARRTDRGDATRPDTGRHPRETAGVAWRADSGRVPRVPAGATGRPAGSY